METVEGRFDGRGQLNAKSFLQICIDDKVSHVTR